MHIRAQRRTCAYIYTHAERICSHSVFHSGWFLRLCLWVYKLFSSASSLQFSSLKVNFFHLFFAFQQSFLSTQNMILISASASLSVNPNTWVDSQQVSTSWCLSPQFFAWVVGFFFSFFLFFVEARHCVLYLTGYRVTLLRYLFLWLCPLVKHSSPFLLVNTDTASGPALFCQIHPVLSSPVSEMVLPGTVQNHTLNFENRAYGDLSELQAATHSCTLWVLSP